MKHTTVAVVAGLVVALTAGARVGAAQAPDGAALYRQHCRTCHGARGTPSARMQGLYPKLVSLADSSLPTRLSADSIVHLLVNGAGDDMKSFSEKLTRPEMVAVAEFVRTLNKAPGS